LIPSGIFHWQAARCGPADARESGCGNRAVVAQIGPRQCHPRDAAGPFLGTRFLDARFLGVRWLGRQTRQPNIREGPAHRQLETALSALASAAAGLSAEPCDRRPSDRAVDYFKTGSRTPNRDGGRAGPKSREKWRIFRAASRHSQERTFHCWKCTAIRPRGVAEFFSRDFFGVGCAL
jgi:hypothetical protein